MKIRELMTSDVKLCGPDTNLAAAAKIMWEEDCGAVPVTDERGRVVGVITDRDICIAAATRLGTEGEIPVRQVISDKLYTCAPSDDPRGTRNDEAAEGPASAGRRSAGPPRGHRVDSRPRVAGALG